MFDLLSSLISGCYYPSAFQAEIHSRGFLFSNSYLNLPKNSIFPVSKYIYLLQEIKNWRIPIFKIQDDIPEIYLKKVHTLDYLNDFLNFAQTPEIESAELPLNYKVSDFFLKACHATFLATHMAAESKGRYANLAGGFHHAFADHAEGFCFLNDISVAAIYLLEKYNHKSLIIDLDLHQGNGIANIFKNNKDIFVFNLHQSDNYPLKKDTSDLDIGLPAGTTGETYLEELQKALELIEKQFKADFIFYIAGADPYKGDILGGFELKKDDLIKRDKKIANWIGDTPSIILPAGGYTHDVKDVVEIHLNSFKIFMNKYREY